MIFKSLRRFPRLLPFAFPVLLIVMYVWSSVHLATANAATQNPIGQVDSLQGKGWSVSTEGTKHDKSTGDVVAMNEVVATGYNSGMTMSFIDDTTLKLGADAQITIDEMVYDPKNGENDTVVMRLGAGAYYFVSGKVAKKNVTIITPTATIGIRGTELLINVSADGSTSVGVAKGRAYMRSRGNSSRTEINLGDTGRADAKGNVSESHKGLDLTGDKDIDRNVEGVSDWMGEDDEKKSDDFTDFYTETHEGDDTEDDGDGEDEGDGDGDGDDEGDGEFSGDHDESDFENDGNEDEGEDEGEGDGDGGDSDGGDGGDSDGGDSDGGDSDSDGGDSDGGDSDSDSSRDGKDRH